MTDNKSILIIIPTYNESGNIQPLLSNIYSLGIDLSVLVVDDNSPDKTAQAVADLQNRYPNLYLITRKRKMGLGSAYIEGFRYALENNYGITIQMDADLSHLPRYIPDMLNLLKCYDLVIGSRYIKQGGVSGWSLRRIWLSKFANTFSGRTLIVPINDLTSGFKCIKSHVLQAIDFDKISARGYAFQIEMVYRVFLDGFSIIEHPIVFHERKKSKSKMSLGIIAEAFFRVIFLAFKKCILLQQIRLK